MKRKELAAILSAVAPTTYNEWAGKASVPKPPFIAYLDDGRHTISGDSKAHIKIPIYRVELYTVKGDDDTEELLENALDENDIYYEMVSREWLKDEKWYMTVYELYKT